MRKKHIDNKEALLTELSDLRYRKGYSRLSMVQYLKENYDLEQARAYDYIREMMSATAKAWGEMNENALADSISFLDELKQKALADGDKKLALEITKELNKVNQLYVEKVMHEVKGVEGINITIKRDRDEE